jgi:hypothetical protein
VARAPDGIVLKRHRDMDGRQWGRRVRLALLFLLVAFVIAALFNAFGQRPSGATASTPGASLEVYSPTRVRGGLIWQARFTIVATRELKDAQLVLSTGWLESNTLNQIEPAPLGQASRNGSLSLDLGHVPRGERHIVYLEFQTNPTNIGHRDIDTQLEDGQRVLLSVHRTLTIFP